MAVQAWSAQPRADTIDGTLRLLRSERHRRAGNIGDPVLPGLFFDNNQSDTRCGGRVARDGTRIDPFGIKVSAALTAKIVVAEGAKHRRRCAGTGGGNGLVGSLATTEDGEGRAS